MQNVGVAAEKATEQETKVAKAKKIHNKCKTETETLLNKLFRINRLNYDFLYFQEMNYAESKCVYWDFNTG